MNCTLCESLTIEEVSVNDHTTLYGRCKADKTCNQNGYLIGKTLIRHYGCPKKGTKCQVIIK